MSQRIAAHHLLGLLIKLAVDKHQWLLKIKRKHLEDLQHYRQPLPQQETTDRHHEPDPDGLEEPAGYRSRPYL